jgi:D-lactate dehydrogenase (cytochrome)
MTSSSTSTQTNAAANELAALLGNRATTALIQREYHSHDESHHEPRLPDIVCFPRSTAETSEILKISARYGVPVVPFGAGTSLEGQVVPVSGGIVLDMRRMNRILRVSAADMDADVEAGVTRKQLCEGLSNSGLTFFIDPGADATIGGMVSTRASGTTAVRYGTMRENVLGLTAVLADGRIIKTGTRARKSAAGYDLTHLLVGSEGTLAVITEVTLRLHALPEAVAAAACAFPSVADAVNTAIEAIQLNLSMARMEFADDSQVRAINRYARTDLAESPMLFFEFHALDEEGVSRQAELLRQIADEHGGKGFRWSRSPSERAVLWEARHNAYYASLALRPGGKGWTTDVCVPISRLAECITSAKRQAESLPFPTTMVGHVGEGNFHVLCILNPDDAHELEAAAEFSEKLVAQAHSVGGTCTGEHGVGVGKMRYMEAEHGEALRVMCAIKAALDPDNRLNPGKMLPQQRP